MTYLVKKLGHQELGSITPTSPTPSRGRYLMIPKNASFLENLPHLSQQVLNDYLILTIIPLYKDHFERNYCTFVYNNDKYHAGGNGGQPRDEYRIYLNKALEGGSLYFERDDILVLKSHVLTTQIDEVVETETVYFAYLEKDHHSTLYKNLDDKINDSRIRGNYAVVNEEIVEVEQSIAKILQTSETKNDQEEFNEGTVTQVSENINRLADNSSRSVDELFTNQSIFRDFVQANYQGLCAITRQVIKSGNFNNLQAAHIYPRSHNGLYTPNNGILMNRDMHWAFDVGCFTINDDYTIQVHPDVQSDYLQSFNGKEIFVPSIEYFRPTSENLSYHRNHIYGGFLERGRII